MDKINKIIKHPLFIQYMDANKEKEKSREFCKHNMEHVMDVARIAYLLNLEEEYQLTKEMVYGAALLHDIGRHVQYETGEKHAAVSARYAPQILEYCGYSEEEIKVIVDSIQNHSNKTIIHEKSLKGLIARADQLSRACYRCPVQELCNWDLERKNTNITY